MRYLSLVVFGILLATPVAAQDPGRVYFASSSCGYRGPLANPSTYTNVTYMSSEGTAWATKQAFITLMNPLTIAQTIRVRLKPDGQPMQEWTRTLDPYGGRGYIWANQELQKRGFTGDINFSTVVLCDGVCVAETITWDNDFIVGVPRSMPDLCEGPLFDNPYGGVR